jgi:hypothetical protein
LPSSRSAFKLVTLVVLDTVIGAVPVATIEEIVEAEIFVNPAIEDVVASATIAVVPIVATVPERTFDAKSIVLLVNVSVPDNVANVPVAVGNVIVGVPATAAGVSIAVPDVDPGIEIDVIPVNDRFADALFMVAAVVPIYIV